MGARNADLREQHNECGATTRTVGKESNRRRRKWIQSAAGSRKACGECRAVQVQFNGQITYVINIFCDNLIDGRGTRVRENNSAQGSLLRGVHRD